MLIVRDFVDPGDGEVFSNRRRTTARRRRPAELLDRAAPRAVRARFPLAAREAGVRGSRRGRRRRDVPAGWRRYRLPLTLAAEFVLRKDYRSDWESKRRRSTRTSPSRFEAEFARLGLRVLASAPLWNPWIVRQRYLGSTLRSLEGAELGGRRRPTT